jgi:hypothetical protein
MKLHRLPLKQLQCPTERKGPGGASGALQPMHRRRLQRKRRAGGGEGGDGVKKVKGARWEDGEGEAPVRDTRLKLPGPGGLLPAEDCACGGVRTAAESSSCNCEQNGGMLENNTIEYV